MTSPSSSRPGEEGEEGGRRGGEQRGGAEGISLRTAGGGESLSERAPRKKGRQERAEADGEPN